MRQVIYLERQDLDAMRHGQQLIVQVGERVYPLAYDPSLVISNGNGATGPAAEPEVQVRRRGPDKIARRRKNSGKDFTDADRMAAIERVRKGEQAAAVAREIGITDSGLRYWVKHRKQYSEGNGDRHPRRTKYSPEFRAKVLKDQREGESFKQLAGRYNIPPGLGWLSTPAGRKAALKAVES